MSQDINQIQSLYEDFITKMKTLTPKIDPILLLKAMRLEKMFSGDLPHVHLEVDFTDDVAVVNNYAYSTDTIAEDIHFFKKDKPQFIAKKLVRVNVSDLLAKGVKPEYCLFNFSAGKIVNKRWINIFIDSIVWGLNPSVISTTNTAISAKAPPLDLNVENEWWPGVSMKSKPGNVVVPSFNKGPHILETVSYGTSVAPICCVIAPASLLTTAVPLT